MNDSAKDFGVALKEERKSRGLTLEEMASILGTSKQVLSRYERGERECKLSTAIKFSNAIGSTLCSNNSDDSCVSIEVGKLIHCARKQKGLTQSEVGNALGVGKAAIQKYENGIASIPLLRIPVLCKLLGLSPNTLFGWESEKTSDAEKESPLKKSDFQCQLTLSYAPKEEIGVGKKLKFLREQTGLSLDKVQRLTGIDSSTLNRYENEVTSKIPLDVFTALCKFYNVTPNEILGFDETFDAIRGQIESLKETGSALLKIAYEIMRKADELENLKWKGE